MFEDKEKVGEVDITHYHLKAVESKNGPLLIHPCLRINPEDN